MTEATALAVDPTNAEQARRGTATKAPTGPTTPSVSTGPWPPTTTGSWPRPRIGRADRVLDIGCGTGQTTRDAARAAADGLGARGRSVRPR